MDGLSYPPAPWRVRAQLHMAMLKMPPGTLPAELRPDGIAVDRRDGSARLGIAWWDYQAGSVLTYRELVVAAMRPNPSAGTVLRIWVDNELSMAGGRALWFMPKEMGTFDFAHDHGFIGAMSLDGKQALSYRFTPRLRVPGRWPFRAVVTQERDGEVRRTTGVYSARYEFGSGSLDIPEDGPLGFLRHGKPVLHMALRDVRGRFGSRAR